MSIFLRIIIAVIAVLFAVALLGPVCRLLGVPMSGDLYIVIRLCIAAIAVFYVLRGPWPNFPRV